MHRPGRCGVGKLLDRVDSAAPDGCALAIASGREFVGPPGAFRLGLTPSRIEGNCLKTIKTRSG